jgi:hypothetical protein
LIVRGPLELAVAAAVAIGLSPAVAGAEAFSKGPYLQNVSRSSVTLMWESPRSKGGTVKLLDGSKRTITSEPQSVHEVVIDGLESGKRYRYEVSTNGETVRGEFATAPEPGAPFSFVVFGDSRSHVASHTGVVERVRREVPDFILGTGDMVDKGQSEADWQKFFDIERDLLRENVLFPSLGNHDRQGRGRTADTYRKYFALPENSPNPERYYAFTYGSSRFLILDSNAYSFALTDQTAWIEEQLQAARLDDRIEHIFVSMHHPPFSVSLHGGQSELREAWTPLFEKYQVAAVFSGHDHVYTRSERNGVHYFVSGGGGAPLYPRKKKSSPIDVQAVRYFERVNHYLRVHVVGRFVEIVAVRADGTVMESVSWGARPTAAEKLKALSALGRKSAAPTTLQIPPEPPGAVAAAPTPVSRSRGGFGPLGVFGALLALVSGSLMIWALRR